MKLSILEGNNTMAEFNVELDRHMFIVTPKIYNDKFEKLNHEIRLIRAMYMTKYLGYKDYVETNYEEGALDMYSTFMMMAMNKITKKGRLSMIVQPTWLVNYSFGSMRDYMLDNFTISSLLHMGRGNFGNDWGSIAFTLSEGTSNSTSVFFKLFFSVSSTNENHLTCTLKSIIPLKEYENMLMNIDKDVTLFLLKAEVKQNTERKEVTKNKLTNDNDTTTTKTARKSTKVGRNEPCPCGSGKKYKQCCGK